MLKKITLSAVFLLLIAGAIVLLKRGLTTKIESTKVVLDTAIDAIPAVVSVRSDYIMTLSSEESGRVIESKLERGSIIKEGDLILKLDPTDLELDAKQLRAEINNLTSRLALTTKKETELVKRQEDLKNFESLYALGDYPELEIIRRRRELEVFKESQVLSDLNQAQQLNNLTSQLEKIERRLEKTTVYAPNDGIATEIFAYPGELVKSGAPIATVFSKAVIVEAKINEEDFAGVKAGMDASVRLLTYGNTLYSAKVSRVLPTADKETQQYTVFLDVDIANEKLLPGLSGEASIVKRRKPDSLIVPRRALLGNFVFKVDNGIARLTPVKVGVRGLNNVEIREGLEEGDIIVTDGMGGLKDGDKVSI